MLTDPQLREQLAAMDLQSFSQLDMLRQYTVAKSYVYDNCQTSMYTVVKSYIYDNCQTSMSLLNVSILLFFIFLQTLQKP